MQRQQHEAADQPQSRRGGGAIAEKRDLLQIFERVRAVMRALDDAVEPDRLGALHQFDIVAEMARDIAGRVLAADDQAELHLSPVSWRRVIPAPSPCRRVPSWPCRSCRARGPCRAHFRRLGELDVRILDDLDAVAPGVEKIEKRPLDHHRAGRLRRVRLDRASGHRRRSRYAGARRPSPLARFRSATSVRLMNWSPMSIKALRSPLPRKAKSKIRPYHSSASSMSPTSIATWLIPTSRGFLPFHHIRCSTIDSARHLAASRHGPEPARI